VPSRRAVWDERGVVWTLFHVPAGDELPRLERACAGRGFQQRRDAAIIE
jgi:hypothetical protein